ncbi:SOS response-associated peptidase [Hyphococcus sp.]|uniref:SOS response-associated peptidase n=1 Tax=Hyphococcus sp. TaxID=2038636 RepID=UPI003CCC1D3C
MLHCMCGRYYLKSPPAELAAQFNVDVRDNFPPRYNIAPTQPIAIIRQNARRRPEYALVRWGFVPEWKKTPETRPLINARSETAAEKPTFRNAMKRRRCLIPADGFYEWKAAGREKQPYAIRRAKGSLFAFAGLWETAMDPGGGEMDTAAILTTGAGEDLKALHRREPVVIPAEDYARWLETDERDIAQLESLLAPGPAGSWETFPVSKDVGNVRNDGPRLIERVRLSLFD